MKEFEDCIKKGLLRSIPPSAEKADASLKTANKWLEEADKDFLNEAFSSSVIVSYLAMFHSARAILFFDGFREKSHYCIARYLEEKYVKNKLLEEKWVELLDHNREVRHDNQYNVNFFATKEEAENSLKTAREFVERMGQLLEKRKIESREKEEGQNQKQKKPVSLRGMAKMLVSEKELEKAIEEAKDKVKQRKNTKSD